MRQRRRVTSMIIVLLAGTLGAALLTSERRQIGQAGGDHSGRWHDVSWNNSVVFQDGANDCGAAALTMILNHFGYNITLREMERRLAAPASGASFQRLKEIAGDFGLQAEGWKISRDDLAQVRLPIIIFLRKNHFVVADSLELSGALQIRDPAVGKMKLSREALSNSWSGEALVFRCARTAGVGRKSFVERE